MKKNRKRSRGRGRRRSRASVATRTTSTCMRLAVSSRASRTQARQEARAPDSAANSAIIDARRGVRRSRARASASSPLPWQRTPIGWGAASAAAHASQPYCRLQLTCTTARPGLGKSMGARWVGMGKKRAKRRSERRSPHFSVQCAARVRAISALGSCSPRTSSCCCSH